MAWHDHLGEAIIRTEGFQEDLESGDPGRIEGALRRLVEVDSQQFSAREEAREPFSGNEPGLDEEMGGAEDTDEEEDVQEEDEEDVEEDEEDEEDEELLIQELPLLDAALRRHRSELSSELLGLLFAASFRRMEDNYLAARLLLEEVQRRKDPVLEAQVVEAFLKACEAYDPGNRPENDTVQDQLVESCFPSFGVPALVILLEGCSNDHLDREWGDAMDALFGPAFARVQEPAHFQRLRDRLGAYLRERLEFGQEELALELLGEISQGIEPMYSKPFDEFRRSLGA
jgi:hypothetical protein